MRTRLRLLIATVLVLPLGLAGAPGAITQAWAAPESGAPSADSEASEDSGTSTGSAVSAGPASVDPAPVDAGTDTGRIEVTPPLHTQLILPGDGDEPPEEPEPTEEPTEAPEPVELPGLAGPEEIPEASQTPSEESSAEGSGHMDNTPEAGGADSPRGADDPDSRADPDETEAASNTDGADDPGGPDETNAGRGEMLRGSTEPEAADDSLALPTDEAYSAQLRVDASGFVNDLGPLDVTLDSAHGPEGGVVAARSGDQDQEVGADLDSRHAGASSTQVRPGGEAALDWAFTEPGTYCLELGFSAAMPARTAEGTRIRRDSVELHVHVGSGAPQTGCSDELVRADPPDEADVDPVLVEEGRARISPGEEGVDAELAQTSADLVDGSGARHEASQVIWSAHRRSEASGRWSVPADQVDAGLDLSGLGDPGRATAAMRMHSGPGTAQYRSATDPRAPHDLLVPPQGRENDRVVVLDRATPGRESATAWNFETAGRYCVDLTVHSRHGEETTVSTTRLTFAAGEDATEVEPCAEPGEDIPDIPLPEGHENGDNGDGSGPGGDDDPSGGDGANGKTPGEGDGAGGLPPGGGDTGTSSPGDDPQDEEDTLVMPPVASACRPVDAGQEVQIRSGTAILAAGVDDAMWSDSRAAEPVSREPDKVTIGIPEDAAQTVRGDALGDFAPDGATVYRTEAAPQDGVPWLGWSFDHVPEDAQVTWSVDSVEGSGEFAILGSNALGEQSVMLSVDEPVEFNGKESGFGSWAFTQPGYYLIWSRFTVEESGVGEPAEAVVPLRFAVGEVGSATSGDPLLQSFLGECEDSLFNGAFPRPVSEDDDPGPFSFFGSSVPVWQWVVAGVGLAASLVLGAAVVWIARGGRKRGGDASGGLLLSGAAARSGGVSGLSGAAGDAGGAGRGDRAGQSGGAGLGGASERGGTSSGDGATTGGASALDNGPGPGDGPVAGEGASP